MTCKKLPNPSLKLNPLDEALSKFLIERYKGLSKEVEFTKLRQWAAIAATITLYGLIINFYCEHSSLFNDLIKLRKGLIFLSMFICITCLIYSFSCHSSLKRNAERMDIVLGQFEAEHEIEKIIKKRNLWPSISRVIPYLVYFINIVAFAVVFCVIYGCDC